MNLRLTIQPNVLWQKHVLGFLHTNKGIGEKLTISRHYVECNEIGN